MQRVALSDPAAAAEAEKNRAPDEAEIPPGAELYWDAFWQLSTDRPQSGFGVHPIPFRAIDAYARRYGIEGDEFETLTNCVRAADGAFVEEMAEKIKRESGNKGK